MDYEQEDLERMEHIAGFEDEEEKEDHEDRCILCGKLIPIEGFCCEPDCLEQAIEGPPLESDTQP